METVIILSHKTQIPFTANDHHTMATVITHTHHKYYPVSPRIPWQQMITYQPTKLPSNIAYIDRLAEYSVNAEKFDKCLYLSIFLARKLIIGMATRQISLNTVGRIIIPLPKNICLCNIIYSN
jgi:hypothetical protein